MIVDEKLSILPFGDGVVVGNNGYIIYRAKAGKRFNLPKGEYDLAFTYKVMNPIPYRIEDMPSPEKNGNKEIKGFSYADNVVGLASIHAEDGIIKLDSQFLKTAAFIRDFVFLHECGHFFYKTEWKCDRYATMGMLKMGWNPSQIATASTIIKNKRRKEKILESIDQYRI